MSLRLSNIAIINKNVTTCRNQTTQSLVDMLRFIPGGAVWLFPLRVLYVEVNWRRNSSVVQINKHVQPSRRPDSEPTVPSANTDRTNSQLKHSLRF